jgi:hypothetical protein
VDENLENLDEARGRLVELAIQFGPRLFVAIVIMVTSS